MVDKGQVTDDIAQDLRAQSLKQAESQSQNDAQNENGTSTFKVWECMPSSTRHPSVLFLFVFKQKFSIVGKSVLSTLILEFLFCLFLIR